VKLRRVAFTVLLSITIPKIALSFVLQHVRTNLSFSIANKISTAMICGLSLLLIGEYVASRS
jgi:hypothetical protein